jgi:pantoate--beta-alanine ligase
MKVCRKILEVKKELKELKQKQKSIGYVPTMGFIHDGHTSLVKKARQVNDIVIVSIFVNPLQFGENEDYNRYPRNEKKDLEILNANKVDIVFLPEAQEMYDLNFLTKITVAKLSNVLCGKSRPGHFDGVCTVLAKFFHIIEPEKAYFGLKDYQQYIIVKKMVNDLNFNISIEGLPIVRDSDGLALSSRNIYLSPEERKTALCLYKSFTIVEELLNKGITSPTTIKDSIAEYIGSFKSTKIDYIEIVDPETLEPLDTLLNKPFLVALAIFVGNTRLIDNKIFTIEHHQS